LCKQRLGDSANVFEQGVTVLVAQPGDVNRAQEHRSNAAGPRHPGAVGPDVACPLDIERYEVRWRVDRQDDGALSIAGEVSVRASPPFEGDDEALTLLQP